MADGVIKLTEGVIGSGKTCCCVRIAVDDFLVNKEGLLITNIPLYEDKIAAYMAKKRKMDPEKIRERLVRIPAQIIDEWKKGEAGENSVERYLASLEMDGAWVLLDEAQDFFGNDKTETWIGEFQHFASKIRHRGATLDLVTQAEGMIALPVRHLVSQSRVIIPSEGRRLPYLKIRIGDLYELWAKLGYQYEAVSAVQERLKVGKRWVNQGDPVMMYRSPEIFELYNSHGANGGKGLKRPLFEFEKRSWPSLLAWFWRRNWFHLSKTALCVIMGIWLLLCGGLSAVLIKVTGVVTGKILTPGKQMANEIEEKPEVAEVVSVPEPPKELTREQLLDMVTNHETHIANVEKTNIELLNQAKKAEQEAKELRKREEKQSGIVAATDEAIMFASGEMVKKGQGVKYGKYKGYIFERVDLPGRTVHFLGGRVLPFGRLPGSEPDKKQGGI